MKLEIPPLFFYGFGVLLVMFGSLRAYHLGWRHRPGGPEGEGDEGEEGDEAEEGEDAAPAIRQSRWSRVTASGYKRHITMGLLWIAMGVFLLVSTAVNGRR